MVQIGFHASHELYGPIRLLEDVRKAEELRFQAAMCSDHFHPWSDRHEHSAFSWSWLAAALERTSLSFGVVCCPIGRYHPALVAQAAATLEVMHPGRFWVAVGSGEALNESITAAPWPPKGERNLMLREAAAIMRSLWSGEVIKADGRIKMGEAKLYTRPAAPPPVFGAALSPETAEFMGPWVDGLITIAQDRGKMAQVVSAFRKTGAGKPMKLQAAISFGSDEHQSRLSAHEHWRQAALPSELLTDLPTPWAFDRASSHLTEEDVCKCVRASPDMEQHLAWLKQDAEMGFESIFLYDVGRNKFIEAFAQSVLPKLREG